MALPRSLVLVLLEPLKCLHTLMQRREGRGVMGLKRLSGFLSPPGPPGPLVSQIKTCVQWPLAFLYSRLPPQKRQEFLEFLALREIKAELTTRQKHNEKAWSQEEGRRNASFFMVSSVNMNLSAYGNLLHRKRWNKSVASVARRDEQQHETEFTFPPVQSQETQEENKKLDESFSQQFLFKPTLSTEPFVAAFQS